MQPLALTIPGNYWDSQLYQGRLYLFTQAGSIKTIAWPELIASLEVTDDTRLALHAGFTQSDYLYGRKLAAVFRDPEIRTVVTEKFGRLSSSTLDVDANRLDEFTLREQDTPFPFPHADSTIYLANLYVASTEGVFAAAASKRNKNPISTRVTKKWDAPSVAVAASYQALAVAAGDDGLFEIPLSARWWTNDETSPRQLVAENCVDCSWTYQSIYASSHVSHGALAAFRKESMSNEDLPFEFFEAIDRPRRGRRPDWTIRRFDRLINELEIFGSTGYSWARHDKLCQAHNGQVSVVQYRPWKDEPSEQLVPLGSLDLAPWKGEVISGEVAVFGTIIECDNALVVALSDGTAFTLPEEPTYWRTFPRSKFYENQLHVGLEGRLLVLSFNHDYFVDQSEKIAGIKRLDPTSRS